MTYPNPNDRPTAGGAIDPLDDPNFDWMAWIMSIDFPPHPEVAREQAIRRWLEAAGFTEIDLRRLRPSCLTEN